MFFPLPILFLCSYKVSRLPPDSFKMHCHLAIEITWFSLYQIREMEFFKNKLIVFVCGIKARL